MKSIKQIITVIALTIFMFTSFSGNAQKILDPNGPGNSTVLEIPNDLKSTKSLDSKGNYTISKYNSKVKGFISITFDSDNKPVLIYAPKVVSKNVILNQNQAKGSPFRECYKDCRGDNDSDVNAGICYYICWVELITGQL